MCYILGIILGTDKVSNRDLVLTVSCCTTYSSDDTAALVLGGIRNYDVGADGEPNTDDDNADVRATAEIFGCPQAPETSVGQNSKGQFNFGDNVQNCCKVVS